MTYRTEWKSPSGFSMIEMMVALGTTLLIATGALVLVNNSLKITNATYNLAEAEQSLRSAHEIINRDLTNAGEGLQGIGQITTPVAFAQNYLTRTPVLDLPDTAHADVGLVSSDDNIPANTPVPQANPATTFLAGSARITILVKDTAFADVSVTAGKITQVGSNTLIVVPAADIDRFRVGEIYAVVSNDATFAMISAVNLSTRTLTLTAGDDFSLNETGSNSPIYSVGLLNGSLISTQAVALVRFQMVQYYADANGLLHRRVFGVEGAGFTDSVVAEHVTALQFRYLTNLTDPNGFVKQPIRVITSAELTAVRHVETTLAIETVRAINKVTNANSSSTICGANANGRQNICSTTATTIRNLQFRNALTP